MKSAGAQEILSKINKQNKQQTKKIVSFRTVQRSLELSISFRLASNSQSCMFHQAKLKLFLLFIMKLHKTSFFVLLSYTEFEKRVKIS